jgi:membrane-bound inhibitor of C-type lysozyme
MYRVLLFLAIIGIGFALLSFRNGISRDAETFNHVLYYCDNNHLISAAYHNQPAKKSAAPSGTVEISLDGGASSTFKQTLSEYGERYADDDEKFVFWKRDDEALVMRGTVMDHTYTNCLVDGPKYHGWTATSTAEVNFRYPDFSHEYITPVAWPPLVTKIGAVLCEVGEVKEIDGTEYCVTTLSEGAAGSTYTTYTYEREGVRAEFTLRFPQCLNYDQPEQTACVQDQESLDVDALADDILVTAF